MNRFKFDKKYLGWGLTAFLVIVACIAFFWVIQRWAGVRAGFAAANAVLTPIIWGLVIAYLLTPFVKFFQKQLTQRLGDAIFKKHPERAGAFARGLAVMLSVVLMLGVIAALFSLVLPQLYRSIESIISNLGGSVDRAIAWVNKWLDDYPDLERLATSLLGNLEETLTKWAQNTLLPQMNNIITSVSLGVITIIKTLANFLIATVASVYVMYSREKFIAQSKKALYSVLSVARSNAALRMLRFTNKAFMSFFSGQLLDALAVGISCYIGCLAIGIKDAVLIAVIVGVTNVIPMFGPFIGGVPSALIVLMYSPIRCLIFVIFIIVLQQLDGNILAPKIIGNKTGLSGFWVMFAILAGAGLFGPVGMIIGVPLFAVVYAALRYLVRRRLKKRGLPLETAEYVDMGYIDPETREARLKNPSRAEKNALPKDPKGGTAPWQHDDK